MQQWVIEKRSVNGVSLVWRGYSERLLERKRATLQFPDQHSVYIKRRVRDTDDLTHVPMVRLNTVARLQP